MRIPLGPFLSNINNNSYKFHTLIALNKWGGSVNLKKILYASLVVWVVSGVYGWLTCGWLFSKVYTLPPNIWKPVAEIMTPANQIGALIVGLVAAFVFVSLYAVLWKGIPGKKIRKGIDYGVLVWLLGVMWGLASMPFYMTINVLVVVYWIFTSLISFIILGAIVGKMYTPR